LPAGANGHVEARQIGLAVDRNPVVGNVVEVDHAFCLIWDAQAGDALGQAIELVLPLIGEIAVEVVGVDPFVFIAVRVLAADQDVVADLGPIIAPDVAVRSDAALGLEIETFGRGDVRDLLAQGPDLDLHAFLDAG